MIGPTNEVNVQTCPSDLQLKQLLDQSLPKTEFEGIEAHIEHCPICKSKLDRFTQFAGDAWLSLAGSSFPLSGVILEPNRITIPGYEMYEIIGSGSHSVVFKAKEIELDRHVALKLFHANPSRTSLEDRERFRREATVLAKLKHPNIVSVFKTGDFNGRPFIITELIDGGTLAEMIENGIPSDRTTAGLLRDIALGIQTAHENTIIHRDLKPSNVLLGQTTNHKSASGTFAGITVIPKIADFGLAKLISEVENQTETGATFGTPAYMAPELAKTGAKAATPASDIYGLGVIGYELLTGHPPFQGTTHYETLKLACDTDPVSPSLIRPSVPRDLETVILKCLAARCRNPLFPFTTQVTAKNFCPLPRRSIFV